MSKSVTLRDIADAAGVSVSTVSRALDENGVCRPVTRMRIKKLVRTMGYQPSPLASALTTNSTKLIGVVIDNFENPFFVELLERFTNELQERQYGCLIVSIDETSDPQQAATMLKRYNVDGVFVAGSTLPEHFLTRIQDEAIPIVHTFGRDWPERTTSVVGIDNVHCGRLAAETLHGAGYEAVALLGGPEDATTTYDRNEGFVTRCAELGLNLVASIHADSYTYSGGRIAMEALLKRPTSFEAVFCGDDLLCMAACDVAKAHGISVPQDIGLMGVNNMMLASWGSYELTTISQPIHAVVHSSVELMFSLISAENPSKEVRYLPCEVIMRNSLKSADKTNLTQER